MLWQLNAYPLMGSLDVLWSVHDHGTGGRVSYTRLGSDLVHVGAAELEDADVTAILGEWLLALEPKLRARPF